MVDDTFARRMYAEQGTQFPTHMALVPFWQATLSWPAFLVKWGAWISLWFFFPWYVPIAFLVAGFLLTALHSATTSGREHQSYFEKKMEEGI
ncbi:MAG: hypothetical protein JRI70_04550 [Deltaproteobacteria bacterium]|nr:hypothetical protein [Deltaproteobacteria bacterium]